MVADGVPRQGAPGGCALTQAIEMLPTPMHRAVVQHHALERRTHQAVADILNLKVSRVAELYRESLRMMRSRFDAQHVRFGDSSHG